MAGALAERVAAPAGVPSSGENCGSNLAMAQYILLPIVPRLGQAMGQLCEMPSQAAERGTRWGMVSR